MRANAAIYETGGREGIRAWLESPDVPPPDYRVNHELGYLDMVVASMARALAHGGAGLAWDDHAICGPWGFALGEVTVPVHLWHGEQDHLIPGRVIDYYAAHLPRVAVTRWPDEGHGGLLSRWPEVLDALCDPAGEAAS